ncbi:MAG: T9SS type A sorting domain-containing protein [Salinivirgaceae bacterium]|nr:T9SS type A sorting domain-containing protein [Salinivirgaceae bacterium]
MKNIKAIVFSFLLLGGVVFNLNAQYIINDTVSDFTVIDVHGNTHNLFSYLDNNKYVCIDFFGLSCYQCLTLVPTFNNVYTDYGCNKSDLVFLAINYFNYNDEVLDFEEEFGGIYPAISGMGGGQLVYEEWQIGYWPQLMLISPDKTLISNIAPINRENIDSVFSSYGIEKESCPTSAILNKSVLNNSFYIYPNPASDIINIDTYTNSIGNIHYKIYNLSGLVMLGGNLSNNGAINISNLNDGFYIIELCQDEILMRKRFSVNNRYN